MKYLWLALFVLFVGVASYFAEQIFFPHRNFFAPETPEALIYQDLKELQSAHELPKELHQVREVFFSDHRLEKKNINWIELSKIFFSRTPEGAYDLQIEAFDAPDEEKKSPNLSIFQFSLFDNSKNKIWEMSRTYSFKSKD